MSFVQSLLSRKFLLAVGSFCVLVANGQYTEAVAVVMTYLGVNAYAEVKGAGTSIIQTSISGESYNVDDVDTTKIVTGNNTTTSVPLFNQELKED